MMKSYTGKGGGPMAGAKGGSRGAGKHKAITSGRRNAKAQRPGAVAQNQGYRCPGDSNKKGR